MHRALRLLLIVGAFGVLLMHSADARATAMQDISVAVSHEHHADGATHDDHTAHWHHVAIACIAIVSTVAGVGLRRRASHVRSLVAAFEGGVSRTRRSLSLHFDTGPPRWLELSVIRH